MTVHPFRILPILVMTVITSALTEGSAQACFCEAPGMAQSYASAATVFIGKVESVTRESDGPVKRQALPPAANGRRESLSLGGTSKRVTTFSVSTVFTGPKITRLEYKTRVSTCDFRFIPGESYLIYAAARDGELKIDTCGRILLLAEASEEVKHLESLHRGRTPALIA